MSYIICYWDEEAQEQKTREATPEELIILEARNAALAAMENP